MGYQFGICEWSLPGLRPSGDPSGRRGGLYGHPAGRGRAGRAMGFPLTHPRVQAAILEAAEESGVCLHSLNLGALLSEGTLNESPPAAGAPPPGRAFAGGSLPAGRWGSL